MPSPHRALWFIIREFIWVHENSSLKTKTTFLKHAHIQSTLYVKKYNYVKLTTKNN